MCDEIFMGIDVGTNETKAVLIDEKCEIVAFASCGHDLLNPQPGFFEHDAEKTWWGDFCHLSRQLLAESGVDAKDVGCVGLRRWGATVCRGRRGHGAVQRHSLWRGQPQPQGDRVAL